MPEDIGVDPVEVDLTVRRLQHVSNFSATISAAIGIVSLAHLAIVLVTVFMRLLFEVRHRDVVFPLLVIDGITLLMSIVLVWKFDQITRRGHLLYQEISDELEKGFLQRFQSLQLRLTLRQFVLDASLPFYRESNFGAGVFVLGNILLSITEWAILITTSRF